MDMNIEQAPFNLYTPEGWLNVPEIIEHCPAWLYVVIGKRQVGKTYGTLLYMLEHDIKHILIRRTVEEVELITSTPELSPYQAYAPDHMVGLFPAKKISLISRYVLDGNKAIMEDEGAIGICVGLPTIAKMRGFNGSVYEAAIFDEFIPEKHVVQRRTEGDALLNAYTTINGNRELKGQPPLKLFLLANANSIASPIMEALGLSDIVIDLMQQDKEYYYNGEIFVCMPRSEGVAAARSETAMMRHLKRTGSADKFMDMALGNKFSYDDLSKVRKLDIKTFKPMFNFNKFMYGWYDPRGHRVYICRSKHKLKPFPDSEQGVYNFTTQYATLYDLYRLNEVYFSDARVLTKFCEVFSINNG